MSLKNKPSYTIFNKNLYKESMRQLRLIGLIATALLMLWEVLIPVGKYTMITAENTSAGSSYNNKQLFLPDFFLHNNCTGACTDSL